MDVGEWLRSLGLGQYEATLRDNEIDDTVLSDLTDGDLEKLGVPMGHRKRLLKAIVSLGSTETTTKPTNPAPTPTSPSAANSPLCSAISSARPRCPHALIPRICARSSGPTKTPAPARSLAMTASSRNSWGWGADLFRL